MTIIFVLTVTDFIMTLKTIKKNHDNNFRKTIFPP